MEDPNCMAACETLIRTLLAGGASRSYARYVATIVFDYPTMCAAWNANQKETAQ